MPLSRRAVVGLLTAASVPLPASAQTAPGSSAAAAAAAGGPRAAGAAGGGLALRERIRAAVAGKDRAALEALYADNFMHMRDSGRADLKPERIALLPPRGQT